MNLNINIINSMIIKSLHDRQNHRTDFGIRGPGFEVNFWRLAVLLSWCLSWFITTKGVKLTHISSKLGGVNFGFTPPPLPRKRVTGGQGILLLQTDEG